MSSQAAGLISVSDDHQGFLQVSEGGHRIQDVTDQLSDDVARSGCVAAQQIPYAASRSQPFLLDDGGDFAQGRAADGPSSR